MMRVTVEINGVVVASADVRNDGQNPAHPHFGDYDITGRTTRLGRVRRRRLEGFDRERGPAILASEVLALLSRPPAGEGEA